MIMILSSPQERALKPGIEVGLRFSALVMRLLAKLHARCETASRRDEAITILSDETSCPDLRDWAERHLCGMADLDARKYLEPHRWQS